jgi:hypothetical protein
MEFLIAVSTESIMESLIFVSLASSRAHARDVLLLAATLRRFGGELSNASLWMLFPAGAEKLAVHQLEALNQLNVRVVLFRLDERLRRFPFAAKVQAAAAAEREARKRDLLVWMDRDTLVLNEPGAFRLPAGTTLGYRPVHHRLIGLAWDTPRDAFWQLIDAHCQVPHDRFFPMTTHAGEQIQPYFNAGSFVVRPDLGLLRAWWDRFQSACRLAALAPFLEQDPRYAIFLHQAIFTGVLLHTLKQTDMRALHPWINYPLHLHREVPPALRPSLVDDLVTARYEDIFDTPDWRDELPLSEELAAWLAAQPRIE